MTQQQLDLMMKQLGMSSDPGIEPPPLPSPPPGAPLGPHQGVDVPPSTFQGNYFPPNVPHAGISVPPGVFPPPPVIAPDVPGQVNVFSETNPPNVTFPPNYWGGELPPINTNDPTRNIATNETMYPDGKFFLGDPDTSYATQPGLQEEPMPNFPNAPPGGDFAFSQNFIDQINPPTNESMIPASGDYAARNFVDDTVTFGGNAASPGDQTYSLANDANTTAPPPPQSGDYFGQNSFDVPFGGSAAHVPSIFPAEGAYLPGEYERFMYGDTWTAGNDTGGSAPAEGATYDDQGNQIPAGPASFPLNTPVTGANGAVGSSYSGSPSGGSAPFVGGGEGAVGPGGGPVIDPRTGEPVAGSLLSESDAAKRYNMEKFAGDPRYSMSSILHPGQTFVHLLSDGTRVLVDAAGKIVQGGIQAGKDLWSNILNDPRNTDPGYLASIGYHEMGPEGSGFMLPAGVTGPSVGTGDIGVRGAIQGGSYFHGGASAGAQHGATSVAGATYNLGGSGPVNAGAIGSRSGALSLLDRQYLMRLKKGVYTTPTQYGERVAGAPSPFPNTPSPVAGGSNWNAFHAGQVQLGDILRANPAYYSSLTTPMPKTGLGPSTPGERLSRGTPPNLPT